MHQRQRALPLPDSPPTVRIGKTAGASEPVLAPPVNEVTVAGTDDLTSVPSVPREDFRVRCTSKRAVAEMLELCGRFLRGLGDA